MFVACSKITDDKIQFHAYSFGISSWHLRGCDLLASFVFVTLVINQSAPKFYIGLFNL